MTEKSGGIEIKLEKKKTLLSVPSNEFEEDYVFSGTVIYACNGKELEITHDVS